MNAEPAPSTPGPRAIRAVRLVAATDILRRFRNRSALITAFAGPLAFAVVFSVLVGGATSPSFTIGIVDADGSALSGALTSGLLEPPNTGEESNPVRFQEVGDRATAEAAVDDGELDAALVIPAGFSAGLSDPEAIGLLVVRSPERAIGGAVAASIASTVAAGFTQTRITDRLTDAGGPPATSPSATSGAGPEAAALVLDDLTVGGRDIEPSAYYGAAMSILFLFFTVGFAARSVIAEKRGGTLARILSGPTSPAAVILGKTLSVSALALAGFVTVWGVTTVIFGADWGPPAAVLALMGATVIAVAGVATLVSSLARTPQQAESYTAVVTFALALIGGNFLGPGQLPDVLRRASLLTPNGWALRGFTDLASGSTTLTSLGPTILVLLGFGVVFGSVGLTRVHRLMLS